MLLKFVVEVSVMVLVMTVVKNFECSRNIMD